MNKFEKLKSMSSSEAQEYIGKLVGEDIAKMLFEDTDIAVSSAKVGSFVKYAGIEWVVLEHREKGTLLLAKDILFDKAFDGDNLNDWRCSSLRQALNNAIVEDSNTNDFGLGGMKEKDLVSFERNLTTDDGMTDYGTCEDFISLITCDEYRKFRKLIPNASDWWWTLTADSIKYNSLVRSVYSIGTLYYYCACGGSSGVRPLCVLKSDTEVEVCED